MYRILIADDEGIVTDSLQYIIQKNFGSECETAIAKNGRQAIETAESFQPDIALLDIQMPGLNGLKALEEIRAQNPRVKTLILTAYDNFDYAKEALRLGALDYLMKPINKKVIIERLTSMMHAIDQERQKRKDDLLVREKMEAVIPMIENGFIMSLIIQNEYEDSGDQYRTLLNIQENYGIIMVLEWGSGWDGAAMGNPVGSGVRAHKYHQKMEELVKVYFKACAGNLMGNKMVCVIPYDKPRLEYENRLYMIEKARSLVGSLKRLVGIDFKAGIGSVRPWEAMFDSYEEALNALRHGKRNVTHIDDLVVKDTMEEQRQAMERIVLKAVCSGLEHDACREATVFAGWALKSQSIDFEEKRLRLAELHLLARRTIQEQGGQDLRGRENMDRLIRAADEEELRQSFIAAMVELAQAAVIKNQEPDGIIARAMDYIEQNFTRDLALEEVAQTVGISPYYFSKLFKEGSGMNYTEYLTKLRIEMAKELLARRELSIKEVCVDSGYANPNYFSRIFKKWTGITPTEFRDGLSEDKQT